MCIRDRYADQILRPESPLRDIFMMIRKHKKHDGSSTARLDEILESRYVLRKKLFSKEQEREKVTTFVKKAVKKTSKPKPQPQAQPVVKVVQKKL